MKATKFNENFPAFLMEDVQNRYILIHLTSLQDASEQLHNLKLI